MLGKVRAELLDTIFTTPTLLHDGAIIIRGDRVVDCWRIWRGR